MVEFDFARQPQEDLTDTQMEDIQMQIILQGQMDRKLKPYEQNIKALTSLRKWLPERL